MNIDKNQQTKDKNDPSSSPTSPRHNNDAPDPASSSHIPYTTSTFHPSHKQTHLFYKTPPGLAHRHPYANSRLSLAAPRILGLQAHHLAPTLRWRFLPLPAVAAGRPRARIQGRKARCTAAGSRLLPWGVLKCEAGQAPRFIRRLGRIRRIAPSPPPHLYINIGCASALLKTLINSIDSSHNPCSIFYHAVLTVTFAFQQGA